MNKRLEFVDKIKFDSIQPSGKPDGISYLSFSTKMYIFVPVPDNFMDTATDKDHAQALDGARFHAMDALYGETIQKLEKLKQTIPARHHAKINQVIRSVQYWPAVAAPKKRAKK